MHALTFEGVRTIRHRSVPDPQLHAPGDAIVRVTLAAVCGSDLHVYRGREIGQDDGTIMGHEFVGEVVEVGPEVERLAVGDAVLSPFSTSCGACFFCERGLTSRCPAGGVYGWVVDAHGLQGAQAEYVRVSCADGTLVPRPADVAPELCLLAGDVIATGLFCAAAGGVGVGDVVVVLGCGAVGLAAVAAAVDRGARAVVAVDGVLSRLELAAAFGARPVERVADPTGVVAALTDGRGADVVLECVGSPEATRQGYDLLRPGGTLSAAGVHTEPAFAITPGEAYDKNLVYTAGRCPARAWIDPALALIRGGRFDLASLLTHRVPLAEGPEAYAVFDAHRDGCTKVLLET